MQLFTRKIGIVIIGRNEGERFKRCLLSVRDKTERIVYVDSGSTDGSITFAKSRRVDVVELDMTLPFTMARGRNSGFRRLLDMKPDTEFVQFIDGDCELVDGYLESAVLAMMNHPDITIVTGRRLERHPDASIYNRLCAIEWGKDLGEIQSCGGDMMVRPEPFIAAGMFNTSMIAGEEPELCVRIRKAGGKIVRIDHDMTIHDAAMLKFSQWWRRAIRAGHASAEGCAIHGRSPERHNVRAVLSALFWGVSVPIVAVGFLIAAVWWPWAVMGSPITLFGYVALAAKISRSMQRKGFIAFDARLYAAACVLAKFPKSLGIFQFWLNRLRGRPSTLIEYKQASAGDVGELARSDH